MPRHLVGIAAQNANSQGVPNDELADIVTDMQAADTMLLTEPSVPIIYRLHCEDAVAVTGRRTSGFRLVNTSEEGSPHLQTVVDTAKMYSLWNDSGYERDEKVTEGIELAMYQPLSFLSTDEPEAVEHFINHSPDWMRYPNSHVVVGRSAVDAFLLAQAKKDILGSEAEIEPRAIKSSWAMLASAALKRLGFRSPIGKHGDIVHDASIEGLADIMAGSLGYYGGDINLHEGDDDKILRRLAGVDFKLRADAQAVGAKATERLFSDDEERSTRYQGLVRGDRSHIETYLTATAGNFMSHLLGVKA